MAGSMSQRAEERDSVPHLTKGVVEAGSTYLLRAQARSLHIPLPARLDRVGPGRMQSTLWGLGPPTASPALPFSCPQCRDRFKTKQALASHRQTHSRVRPVEPRGVQPLHFAREPREQQGPSAGQQAGGEAAAEGASSGQQAVPEAAAEPKVETVQTDSKKRKLTKQGLEKQTRGASQRKRYKASEVALAIAQHEAARAIGAPARQGDQAAGTSVAYILVRKWIKDKEKFAKQAAKETRDELSRSKAGWFRQFEPQKQVSRCVLASS